jgi:hypothetical protein
MAIEPSLSVAMRASRERSSKLAVIVSFAQADDTAVLHALGVEPTAVYQSIAAAAATLTIEQIESLAARPEVTLIELDSSVQIDQRSPR